MLGPVLFNLFIDDIALRVRNRYVDCDMLADYTTLHITGKDILQIRNNVIIIIDKLCIMLFSGVPKLIALYNILHIF